MGLGNVAIQRTDGERQFFARQEYKEFICYDYDIHPNTGVCILHPSKNRLTVISPSGVVHNHDTEQSLCAVEVSMDGLILAATDTLDSTFDDFNTLYWRSQRGWQSLSLPEDLGFFVDRSKDPKMSTATSESCQQASSTGTSLMGSMYSGVRLRNAPAGTSKADSIQGRYTAVRGVLLISCALMIRLGVHAKQGVNRTLRG